LNGSKAKSAEKSSMSFMQKSNIAPSPILRKNKKTDVISLE
jgi:hypothetical protein